tara:strand:+ start:138 stop:770 length:633 start_codon:yes stop_codon:yes gene_type:complete
MKKIFLLFSISFFTSCAVNTSLLESYEYPQELKDKLNSDEIMATRDVMVSGGKSYRYVVTEIIPKIKENRKSEDKSLKRQTRKKLKAELDSIKRLLISYNRKIINGRNNKKNREFYSEMNRFLEIKKEKGFKSTTEYQEWKSHRKTINRFLFNGQKFQEYYANINWNEKSDTFIQAERHLAYQRYARLRTAVSILYYEIIFLLIVAGTTG